MYAIRSSVLAMLVAAASASGQSQPQDQFLGTWVVNLSQSRYSAGSPPKFQVSTWEALPGGALKVTTYAVNAAGAANCTEVITRMDGADSPITDCSPTAGSSMPRTPTAQTRSYQRTPDGNFVYTTKVNGQATTTTRQTLSNNGNTRTNVTTGTNAAGQRVNNSVVYERMP